MSTHKKHSNSNTKHTLKKNNVDVSVRNTDSQYSIHERIGLIFAYMIDNMKRHDEIEIYKVKHSMLSPYLHANNINAYSQWSTILSEYRHLLYIDQFVNFYEKQPKISTLDMFVRSPNFDYYLLPTLQHVMTTSSLTTYKKSEMEDIYTQELKVKLEPILQKFEDASCNITDVSLLIGHNGYLPNPEILTVPDDVIIAYVTPLNKYSYQEPNQHIKLFSILNHIKKEPGFLKNPSCFLRKDNCLKHTVYYFPGQNIINTITSTQPNKDIFYHGFYIGDDKHNYINEIFTKSDDTFSISLKELFLHKYKYIKGKIVYITGCRKCELSLYDDSIEFLYRYEHILNYINMSKCSSYNIYKSKSLCLFSKARFEYEHNITNKNIAPHIFYDSALSYDFNAVTKMKKAKYMLQNQVISVFNNNLQKKHKIQNANTHSRIDIIQNLVKKVNLTKSEINIYRILYDIARLINLQLSKPLVFNYNNSAFYNIRYNYTSALNTIKYITNTNLLTKLQKTNIFDNIISKPDHIASFISNESISIDDKNKIINYFVDYILSEYNSAPTIYTKTAIINKLCNFIQNIHLETTSIATIAPNIINIPYYINKILILPEHILNILDVLYKIPVVFYNYSVLNTLLMQSYNNDIARDSILTKFIKIITKTGKPNIREIVTNICQNIYKLYLNTLKKINNDTLVNITRLLVLFYNTSDTKEYIPICKLGSFEDCIMDENNGAMFCHELLRVFLHENKPFDPNILNIHSKNPDKMLKNAIYPYDYYLMPIDMEYMYNIPFKDDTLLQKYISTHAYILFPIIIHETDNTVVAGPRFSDMVFYRSHHIVKHLNSRTTIFKPINIAYFGFITYCLAKLSHATTLYKHNYNRLLEYFKRLCQDDMIICPEYSAIYTYLYILIHNTIPTILYDLFTPNIIAILEKPGLITIGIDNIPDTSTSAFKVFINKYEYLLDTYFKKQSKNNLSNSNKQANPDIQHIILA